MASNAADFSNQYNLSYITRFDRMKELIMSNPALGEYSLPMKKLSGTSYEECIVIAILFVDSTAKYSILRQDNNEDASTYFNKDSQLLLEDSSGKIQIVFKNRLLDKLSFLSSGMVLGFVGCKNDKKQFECSDVVFPKPLDGPRLAIGSSQSPKRVLILSNVCLNKGNYERTKLLLTFYSGRVSEIIIFGDLLGNDSNTPDFEDFNSLVAGMSCTISIVPGMHDPTSRMLPQQPLPKMLFGTKMENIRFLPHPCETTILDKSFVLINNEIVDDLLRYRSSDWTFDDSADRRECAVDSIDVLEQLVKIRHMAPSCPDTLSCIPFIHKDPFIICECDYLIAGGSTRFAHKVYKGITLICVKDFQLGGSGVVLDTSTNALTEVKFAGF